MKTIKQHLEELPEQWRPEALENARKVKSIRFKVPNLADALKGGFVWISTKQGDKYWRQLHNSLGK